MYNKIMEAASKIIAAVGSDGLLHMYVCTISVLILNTFLSWFIAILITVALAIGKEILDKKYTNLFSKKDLICDGIGIAIAVIIIILQAIF